MCMLMSLWYFPTYVDCILIIVTPYGLICPLSMVSFLKHNSYLIFFITSHRMSSVCVVHLRTGGIQWLPPHLSQWNAVGPSLGAECSATKKSDELLSMASIPWLGESMSPCSVPPSSSYMPSAPSSWTFLRFQGSSVIEMPLARLSQRWVLTYTCRFSQLWISAITTTPCKNKLLWKKALLDAHLWAWRWILRMLKGRKSAQQNKNSC